MTNEEALQNLGHVHELIESGNILDALEDLSNIAHDTSDKDVLNNVLETINTTLMHDKIDSSGLLGYTFYALGDIAENTSDEELLNKVFETVNATLKHDKIGSCSLITAFGALGYIAKNTSDEKVVNKVFKTIKNTLKKYSDKIDSGSLSEVFGALENIAQNTSDEDVLNNVFNTFNATLKHDKIDSAFCALRNITQNTSDEKVLNKVFKTIKNTLKKYGDKIDSRSLREAFEALANIAKKTSDEEILDKVFNTTQQTLTHPSYDLYRQSDAIHIFEMLINKNPQKYAQSVLNNVFLMDSAFSEYQKYYLLSRSMKYKDINLEALSNEQKEMCTKAKKLRFSTYEECKYIMDNQISWDLAPRQAGIRSYLIQQLPENEKNNNWLIPASFKLAQIFKTGGEYKTYIDQMQRYGISVHDALYWLPDVPDDTQGDSFKNFLLQKVITRQNTEEHKPKIKDLTTIANSWSELTTEEQQLTIKELVKICSAKRYKDVKYPDFAVEASNTGLATNDYKQAENIYEASLEVPEPFDSTLIFESGAYKGRFLPRNDPRVGFFGRYTNCCQHFGGVGGACAISSMLDPYSQLFVIENSDGEIIAGSWVWQNTESGYKDVCFDDIEGLCGYFVSSNPDSDTTNKNAFKDIYEQAGQYLITQEKCKRVNVGTEMGRFKAIFGHKKETELIPLPKHYGDKYSDATHQSLLAENPDAPQWDETQEKCFIRKDEQNIHDTLLVINPSGYTVGRCQINESETRVEFKPKYTPDDKVVLQLFERIMGMNPSNHVKVIGNEKTIKKIVRMTSKFNSQGYKKMEKDGKTFYQITLCPQKDDENTPISPVPVASQPGQSNNKEKGSR